jgi:RNA polymerase sigma-70 factor (ECF subfamily)
MQILRKMTPKKREVLVLFELEGLSGEEIATCVGCPVDTVWSRLHHARRDFLKLARRGGYLEDGEAP